MPESMYEDLINRIDEIKVKYMQDSRIQINVNFKEENSLMISDQLKKYSLKLKIKLFKQVIEFKYLL